MCKWSAVLCGQTDGSTSLLRAARSGNVERVVELLATGKIDINTCNAVRHCSFHYFPVISVLIVVVLVVVVVAAATTTTTTVVV